jgi:hypothetical protein
MRRKSNSFWDFAEMAAVDAHETLRASRRHRRAELGLQKLTQSAPRISILDNWNERTEELIRV